MQKKENKLIKKFRKLSLHSESNHAASMVVFFCTVLSSVLMIKHFLQVSPLLAPAFFQDLATHSKRLRVGAFLWDM